MNSLPRSVQKLECTTLANESYATVALGLATKLAILEQPRSDRRDRVTLVTANESSCITIVLLEHAPKSLATSNMSNQ